MASAAVLAARARRTANADAKAARVEWFARNVANTVEMTLKQRVTMATHHLQSKIVKNISVPVGKVKVGGGRGAGGRFRKSRVRVTERSKPGEFPRADTTQLMKTIFSVINDQQGGRVEGHVGTPIGYGLVLETNKRLNRSFLVRTFNAELAFIRKLLSGPIK